MKNLEMYENLETLVNSVLVSENELPITENELVELLKPVTKSTISGVVYLGDESKSKTVAKVKQVQKLVYISHFYLNHNYQNKVQKLSGDTEFQAFELKGKTRISTTLIQSDKTEEISVDGKILHKEHTKVLSYYHNYEQKTKTECEELDLFTGAYYDKTPKTTAGRGVVSEENDFIMITLGINKIIKIKVLGQVYRVIR